VKKLDPRWARKGVTAAFLKAAGYSADVAVETDFVGDLPAHLSCWSDHLGRSDVTVAKVAAPASDPSLRNLPRSIQFQGLSVSVSASRILQTSTSSASPQQLTPQAGTQKGKEGGAADRQAKVWTAASITSPAASIASCMLTGYCGAARRCA